MDKNTIKNEISLNESQTELMSVNDKLDLNDSLNDTMAIDDNLDSSESINESLIVDNTGDSKESNSECKIVLELLLNISNKIENAENFGINNNEEKKKKRPDKEFTLEQKRFKKEERKKLIEERRKLKEEKRKMFEEKKKILEMKRKEKEQEVKDKKMQNEIKRQIKEAQKEQKKQELEKKRKLEEEDRLKKLDEKRKLEEEKLNKQKQISNKFLGFFQKISPNKKLTIGNFQVQKNQIIANYVPKVSKDNFVIQNFDFSIKDQNEERLYLFEIKNKKRKPFKYLKNNKSIIDQTDSNIIITRDTEKKLYKNKLLQFRENYRPAYFGTWRKRSLIINGRKPFAQDKNFLDYSIDSDEEWIVDDGESLKDSDSESKDGDNEYEFNEFFVPDGQISDDEQIGSEHKLQVNINEKLLKDEKNKKTQQLVPKALGCFFMEDDDTVNKENFAQWEQNKVIFIN